MLNDVSKQTATNIIIKIAGENISANKVIYINEDAYLASSDQASHRDRIAGLSVASALTGASIKIRTFGEQYNNTWSWDVTKPIFCGVGGELTQTAPVSGFVQIIGTAIDTNRIFINIKDSTLLI